MMIDREKFLQVRNKVLSYFYIILSLLYVATTVTLIVLQSYYNEPFYQILSEVSILIGINIKFLFDALSSSSFVSGKSDSILIWILHFLGFDLTATSTTPTTAV
jgi:hypothetical protein